VTRCGNFSVGNPAADAAFDPAAMAAKLWSGELRAAAQRAAEASVVATAIRYDPEAAVVGCFLSMEGCG
jgi:hypothetical protein